MQLAEAVTTNDASEAGRAIIGRLVIAYLLISAAYLGHHAFMEQSTFLTRVRRFVMAIGCVVLIVLITRFWL